MEIQPLKNVLNGTCLKKPPVWFMRQAGRYLPEYKQTRSKFPYFKDFLFSTSDIVDVTLQPLNRFNLDAAIIFSDILVVPMILGSEVDVVENLGPQLSVIRNPDEIGRLNLTGDFAKCEAIYEAIANVRAKLDANKSLIGFAGGPWTVASYMIEGKTSKTFSHIKSFGYRWPKEFQELLNLISDITAQHLINQIEAGADVIKIFDSWAGTVPFHKVNDWIIKPHQRIVGRVRSIHPNICIISFNKGLESAYNAYLENVPVNGVALGSSTDLTWASKNINENTVLQGALDPQCLVVGGSQLIEEVEKQYEIFSKRPYIFNLGHGIVPETPLEHVQVVIDTLERISK